MKSNDHCRIGSLEMLLVLVIAACLDHCRIGSLESLGVRHKMVGVDHCRIGSLENALASTHKPI